MTTLWTDLLRLFFPKPCCICGRRLGAEEKEFCFECASQFSHTDDDKHPNRTEELFIGLPGIKSAYALFTYKKGDHVQRLIHALKYHDRPKIGYWLGKMAAEELKKSDSPLLQAEVIVPVPLHPARMRSRGYNQSEWIARGFSEVWNIPIDTRSLIRIHNNTSQTKHSATERWLNTSEIFSLARPDTAGKHILLIDDVITTGSTLTHCAEILLQQADTQVSIFALARV